VFFGSSRFQSANEPISHKNHSFTPRWVRLFRHPNANSFCLCAAIQTAHVPIRIPETSCTRVGGAPLEHEQRLDESRPDAECGRGSRFQVDK
jgi:hypothetical protein